MNSYENDMEEKLKGGKDTSDKLEISLLKFFWQAGPFTSSKSHSVPKFLRKISVLKDFTDNELRILTKYLHYRNFSGGEIVFNQGDLGIGFYFIYRGQVDIIVERDSFQSSPDMEEVKGRHVISLDRFDYFGELALLQDNSVRNATAVANDVTELLGIFKPDLDHLINEHPVVATKLLQSISVIVANRLFSLTREVRLLKDKITKLEKDAAKK